MLPYFSPCPLSAPAAMRQRSGSRWPAGVDAVLESGPRSTCKARHPGVGLCPAKEGHLSL